ncbi:tRNA 2-thiocytidine biosynthesis protein TtcA [uncultured Desulfatiglans sp.]|nr:tRNA 2-thiocytidine biosynthesis protein TtcA [uncultured Desulfatiglans sp.]
MGYARKEVVRLMGRAVHRQAMLKEGDHVLVAVSGGKDSMTVLWLLRERLRRVPISYRLTAVHVDPGFGGDSAGTLRDFFVEHGFEHRIIRTDIGPRAHSPQNLENPCFLCARLRRKILFDAAGELGCNLLAFGHHRDDVIETFLLNLFYGGSISTMLPVQTFFDGRITVIRPLYEVPETHLSRYAREMGWPPVELACPSAGSSKRREIKELLAALQRTNRKIKGNIFHALHNVRAEYLPPAS